MRKIAVARAWRHRSLTQLGRIRVFVENLQPRKPAGSDKSRTRLPDCARPRLPPPFPDRVTRPKWMFYLGRPIFMERKHSPFGPPRRRRTAAVRRRAAADLRRTAGCHRGPTGTAHVRFRGSARGAGGGLGRSSRDTAPGGRAIPTSPRCGRGALGGCGGPPPPARPYRWPCALPGVPRKFVAEDGSDRRPRPPVRRDLGQHRRKRTPAPRPHRRTTRPDRHVPGPGSSNAAGPTSRSPHRARVHPGTARRRAREGWQPVRRR